MTAAEYNTKLKLRRILKLYIVGAIDKDQATLLIRAL